MRGGERDRLLIFADPNLASARLLLPAFLHALRSRKDIKVVAICDTARRPPLREPWWSCVAWLRHSARRAFNSRWRGPRTHTRGRHLYGTARRSGVPVVVPPERNVNHPEFIALLKNAWRPTLALSLGCLQIFRPPLLDAFEMAVNFHDGYLPFYKGLAATAWSLYHRESHTGYTYHVIDGGIDSGPVLVQNSIPVPLDADPSSMRMEKIRLAARDAARVLDLMAARFEGTPQREPGSYFSAAGRRRISTIGDPARLSSDEILHRLRCFEILRLRIGGRLCEVTELREGSSRSSFITEDGVTLAAHRMLWLPPWLYRLYRWRRPLREER
jgi:folate-dependent phosphoribosylglycinamide formyltransferase PurN